eukprot:CAMPEP_0204834364 /NCGR_PEP_ID=MMETSP1346-20131115/19650_1 /ASSEMBLY_ACC=CAM_ASM_000771 /TAXON_ID=215587 /ORGANISM="Aplanochytrium stocchinoi, Strain GSBS06" /LENGTH=273 /DNA_ID=CAMNT_0051967653 /DNA_START=230 /DNA_END=1051 /DNA_ORIENTATION=+
MPVDNLAPEILRPPYAVTGIDPNSGNSYSLFALGSKELEKMRDACAHARETLEYAGSLVKPGVTTDEIDRKVFEHVVARKIYPSPLGYRGFPKSLCSSINEVLCHGVPDDRELVEGDIVNLDVSTYVKGYHGDTSATFRVGKVSEEADRLCKTTEACLVKCIETCGPGIRLNRIGEICAEMSEEAGYQSSDTFCGHGIGTTFHMAPLVFHTRNANDMELVPGLVFTIEPIFCEGSMEFNELGDGWTVATVDGGLASQYEHTIIITDNGAEILT